MGEKGSNGTVPSKKGSTQTIVPPHLLERDDESHEVIPSDVSHLDYETRVALQWHQQAVIPPGPNDQKRVPELQLSRRINISHQHVTVTDLGKRTVRNDSVKELKVARERTDRSNSKAPHLYLYKSSW